MYTSVFALGLILAPNVVAPDGPTWLTDYAQAMEVGQRFQKPVAIFVGSGTGGQASLVKEGQFSPDAFAILKQNYVCAYLDRSQSANQKLAREFGITLAGLVISDRSGDYQAFHQDGAISQAELTNQLRRFGDPNFVVTRTVSNTTSRTSYYGGSGAPPSGFSTQPFGRTFSSGSC